MKVDSVAKLTLKNLFHRCIFELADEEPQSVLMDLHRIRRFFTL